MRFFKEMRGSAAALIVLLAGGLVGPSLGQLGPSLTHLQRGTITTIDSVSMNFACHGRTEDRLYWVTRATRFRAGSGDASFFGLKTGQPVNVISHRTGNLDIADLVIL